MALISMIKDLTKSVLVQRSCMSLIVILAQFEVPLVSTKLFSREGVDTGVSMDFEMG